LQRVRTWEVQAGGPHEQPGATSLNAAAARLPHGAYTTLRTYDGRRLLRLDAHFRRLEESAALSGQPALVDKDAARAALRAVLAACAHPESRLRLTFAPPRLFVSVEPFVPLPASLYESGVACTVLDVHRDNPHAKDTRFIATADAAYGALPPGVHEGLMAGADGALLEGLTSNFFAVAGGALRTEEERVLQGVTRSLVLELAAGLVPRGPGALRIDERGAASEAFVTSVSRGVLPVVRIDDAVLGEGRPGAVTRELIRRLRELEQREAVAP
jgi:branched-chain amino acid aminotransferase